MVRFLVTVAALFLCCAQSAPPDNPVLQHYRAYRAAFEAQDFVTAEREADAALQASITRDGNGGRTGVLAVNLAQLRLSTNRAADALEPAQLAQTIAASAPGNGVDPLQASLLVGRAELATPAPMRGRDHLLAALGASVARPEVQGDAYDAALDLGTWAFSANRFQDAIPAWEYAAQFSTAAPGDLAYARARALTSLGQAHFLFAVDRLNFESQRDDTHIRFDSEEQYTLASQAFSQAGDLMALLAYSDQSGAELTTAQIAYGETLAWRSAMRAYIRTNGGSQPPSSPRETADAQCELELVAEPLPTFPPSARARTVPGAVAVRVLVDDNGAPIDRKIVAAVPGRWFRDAVERVIDQWRIEPEDAAAECAFPRVRYAQIYFYFE